MTLPAQAPATTERIGDEPATDVPVEPVAAADDRTVEFDDVALKGKGSKVVKLTIPSGSPAIAKISCKCRGNFVIWTVDPNGDEADLLVNTIGGYAGTVLFSEFGDDVKALEVEADAAWSILVRPVIRAPAWNGSKALKGKGDAVYRLTPPASGFTTLRLANTGDGNLAIWAYGDTTTALIVNEIGNYRGETLLADGTFLLEIETQGSWSIAQL